MGHKRRQSDSETGHKQANRLAVFLIIRQIFLSLWFPIISLVGDIVAVRKLETHVNNILHLESLMVCAI